MAGRISIVVSRQFTNTSFTPWNNITDGADDQRRAGLTSARNEDRRSTAVSTVASSPSRIALARSLMRGAMRTLRQMDYCAEDHRRPGALRGDAPQSRHVDRKSTGLTHKPTPPTPTALTRVSESNDRIPPGGSG